MFQHSHVIYSIFNVLNHKFTKFKIYKQVNASPSLTANTPGDYDLKFGLLDDVCFLFVFNTFLILNLKIKTFLFDV